MITLIKGENDSGKSAFAVIYCGIYLLVSFGLFHAVFQARAIRVVCVGFILSRALASLGAVTVPTARKGGMVWLLPASGGLSAGFVLLVFFGYHAMALKQFGGVTGDTTGFLLQSCEFAVLFGTWIGGLL